MKNLAIASLLVASVSPALADPAATPTPAVSAETTPSSISTWKISIDSDPSTFAFHGFSGWLMAKPAGTRHLRLGVGTFGLEFPSVLTPHLNGTGEDGWTLSARAVMGFAGYVFGDRKGLYVGAYSGYLQSRHERDDMPGVATEHNLTVLPTIGYQWFPFHDGALKGAYLQPWAGATVWIPVGGTTSVGMKKFEDPHVIPIAAVHLGYEF